MTFLNAMREMRATLAKRAAANTLPVMAVIGAGEPGPQHRRAEHRASQPRATAPRCS